MVEWCGCTTGSTNHHHNCHPESDEYYDRSSSSTNNTASDPSSSSSSRHITPSFEYGYHMVITGYTSYHIQITRGYFQTIIVYCDYYGNYYHTTTTTTSRIPRQYHWNINGDHPSGTNHIQTHSSDHDGNLFRLRRRSGYYSVF